MSITVIAELRKMNALQLNERMDELGAEAMKLRFQHGTGQLQQTARVRQVRREVARIKTILAEQARIE
ncbi:MAG: 50S ribosomal protein L29 [Mariprofundales bacterium]